MFSCVALSMLFLCCLEDVEKPKKEVVGVICIKLYQEKESRSIALLISVVSTHICACVLTF